MSGLGDGVPFPDERRSAAKGQAERLHSDCLCWKSLRVRIAHLAKGLRRHVSGPHSFAQLSISSCYLHSQAQTWKKY